MEDSSRTRDRQCQGSSVADASSSSSTASSKRSKVTSPVEGRAGVASSRSELASCEKLKVGVRSPSASFVCCSELLSSNSSSVCPASYAPLSSCGSGDVVEETLLVGNQQEKSLETETSTCTNGNFSREATPSSELCHNGEKDSKKMERQQLQVNNRRTQELEAGRNRTMPPQAEIEEFFSAAEKYEQKRFTEKYNYDIVKDVPLQGRYQWVLLKP